MPYSDHQSDSSNLTIRCAIVTLSDTRTPETDTSGQRIRQLLESNNHSIPHYHLIPDDPSTLRSLLTDLLSRTDIDAIITNGGTGISRRDTTIEVVQSLLTQTLPGFGELFRMLSYHEIGSGALVSRALAGVSHAKLLFSLPGSTNAITLAMAKLILPELKHLLHELKK